MQELWQAAGLGAGPDVGAGAGATRHLQLRPRLRLRPRLSLRLRLRVRPLPCPLYRRYDRRAGPSIPVRECASCRGPGSGKGGCTREGGGQAPGRGDRTWSGNSRGSRGEVGQWAPTTAAATATATATVTTAATATLPADDDSARSMAFWVQEPLPTLHAPFPFGGHCTGNRRQRPRAANRPQPISIAHGLSCSNTQCIGPLLQSCGRYAPADACPFIAS